MPRTKKDTNLIPSEEGFDQAAPGMDFSQTDSELGGEPGAGSLSDLELASATSLDPDAPQTDSEMPSDMTPTESGTAVGDDLSQTDLKSADEPEDRAHPAADLEGEPASSQTDPEMPPDMAATESGTTVGDALSQTDSGQPQKIRMPGRRGPRVVSIDTERTVETDVDKQRNDLLDLVESLKGKKILSGTIQGVEHMKFDPEKSAAVVYHGDYKVLIPAQDMVEEPEDYRGRPKSEVLYYLLQKRMSAEVDYIIKVLDPQTGIISASRLEAMAMKRREYYFRTDRDGNYQIYEGIRAEARVVSVIRAGIFVDLFGAECYIPLRELSYQRWVDASTHFQPGQRVLVKVLEVDRSDRDHLRVSASVKQASENPYEKALKKYTVGNRYVGAVSMVDTTGVFVSLDGGIDCLCTYPKRGRPPRGCRVTVRILGINEESNRIWGVITHMSTAR